MDILIQALPEAIGGLIVIIIVSLIGWIKIKSRFLSLKRKREVYDLSFSFSNSDYKYELPEKFEFIKIISDSQMSRIFLVSDKENQKKFLLKLENNPIEKRNLIFPDSDRISKPIEFFTYKEKRFELFNYIDGWTLSEIMKFNKTGVSGALLHSWTQQLLRGLIPLHEAGIVHRDINPSNILVVNESLRLILLDLSGAIHFEKDKNQVPIGTFGFTPGEQLKGNAITQSDIYAVGMVIYFINTLKLPSIFSDRVKSNKQLSLFNITPTTNLQDVFDKMTNPNPLNRYIDARDALVALRPPHTIFDNYESELILPSGDKVKMTYLQWKYYKQDGEPIYASI